MQDMYSIVTNIRILIFGLTMVCLAADAVWLRVISLLTASYSYSSYSSTYNPYEGITGVFAFGILNDIIAVGISGYYFLNIEKKRGLPPTMTDFIIVGVESVLWLPYSIVQFVYEVFIRAGAICGLFILILYLINAAILYQWHQQTVSESGGVIHSNNANRSGMNNSGMGTNNNGMGMNNNGMGMSSPAPLNTSGMGLNTSGMGLNTSGMGLNGSGATTYTNPVNPVNPVNPYGGNNQVYVANGIPYGNNPVMNGGGMNKNSPIMSHAQIEKHNAGSEVYNATALKNAGAEMYNATAMNNAGAEHV